jgi:hypothetical protein
MMRRVMDVVEELHKLPLVHVSAIAGKSCPFSVSVMLTWFLADVWPWLGAGPELPSVTPEPGYLQGHSRVSRGPMSLWDQAMAVLVQTFLSSTELDQSLLDTAMQIPNFKSSLKRHLVTVKQLLPEAPTTPALLRAAYAGDDFLDWSPFTGLAPATITAALSGPELQGARGLSLCADWTNVLAPDLAQAICTLPSLCDLYLMELPNRTADGPIGEFYTALMAHPRHPRGKVLLCGAGSCALRHERWLTDERALLPLTAPNPVLQLAVVFDRNATYPAITWLGSSKYSWVNCFFLGDGFLTPVHVVNGFTNFIAHALGHGDGQLLSSGSAVIFSSRAAPTLGDPSALEIRVPSAESFAIAAWDEYRGSRLRDLLADTWTAVLHIGFPEGYQDGDEGCPLAQCSFVRPRHVTIRTDPTNPRLFRPEDLDVLSLEEFVRVAVPDFNNQSAISLDRRLRWYAQFVHFAPSQVLSGDNPWTHAKRNDLADNAEQAGTAEIGSESGPLFLASCCG